jgi:SpoIIAA-like
MSDSGIRFIDPPQPNERLIAYELSGNFTGDDMRTFIERLEKISNSGQKALLYQDMTDRGSVDFEAITEKFKNLGTIWRAVEKIAIVGDARWLEIYIGIVDHLTPQQMKYFDRSEKDDAFAWLID